MNLFSYNFRRPDLTPLAPRYRTGYAMPFATINGIKTNYLVQGTGPHLLMFAAGGWRSVISRWTPAGGKEAFGQMDGLATLSRHFTCIA